MIDKQALAEHAIRLKNDEVLQSVFATIEAECVEAWKATGFTKTEDRERVWTLIKAVGRIRGGLEALITDGKIEAARLVREPLR